MPDEETRHESDNSSQNQKANHSSYCAESLFIFWLCILWRWQEPDWSVQILVLKDTETFLFKKNQKTKVNF